jgi:Carboxypeptidase regulatory-like domain
VVECTRLESEQTLKGLGSSNLPLSDAVFLGKHWAKETHMNRALIALAGLMAFLTAATAPASSDMMARVAGKATVGTSKVPVVAATITVRDSSGHTASVTTDKSGRYAAIGLEPGNVTVSFEAAGFRSQGRTCHVPAGETGRFDFRVNRLNTMSSGPVAMAPYRCDVEPSTVDRTTIR